MKKQFLDRLRSTPIADFLKSPYFKLNPESQEAIATLQEKILADPPDESALRILLLASLSAEIKSISENMLSEITEQESVDRASTSIDDILKSTDPTGRIVNRDRFPGVEWLDPEEYRAIGTVGADALVLLGVEEGAESPIVAKSITDDPSSEELHAMSLHELMAHCLDPISITEDFADA